AELAKRTSDIAQRHRDELHALTARTKELEAAARVAEQQNALEIQHANRRVEDSLREAAELRERNQLLEAEMSKVARVGKREEMDFAEEARVWAGICVSEKLPRNGDFILAFRDPSGAPLEPRMLVDNKDKTVVTESDIDRLLRDAQERSTPVAGALREFSFPSNASQVKRGVMHSLPIEMRGAPPHAEGSQPEDFYFLWSESAQKSALVSAEEETRLSPGRRR